ncbi:MAG: FimV/HubP family polar landmark protein [Candidatus Competibacteraceae bacterium]
MTRKPLQLLIALACSTPLNAVALGVGQIQVRSALHQVLDAEIPLLLAGPGEAAGITAKLAPAQAFAQKGIDRLPVLSSLVFSVQTGADGRGLIKVTSKQPIREPLLNFLIQVDWPKGQVLREVAVLLDPPVKTKQRPAAPAPSMPALAQSTAPSLEPSRQPAAPAPPPSAPPPPPVAHRGTATYGPVPFGETLWSIASRVRPDPTVSVQHMMQALLAANPKAFWKPNVNGLRAGAQLRIPSAQEIDPQRFSEQVSRQLAGRQQVPVAAVAPRPASPPGGEPKVRLVSPEPTARPQQPPPVVSATPPERVAPASAGASSYPIKLNKDNHPALRVAGLEELRRRINVPGPGEEDTAATRPPPVAAVQPAGTRQPQPEIASPPATGSVQPEPRLQEILPETIAPSGTSKDTGVGPTQVATPTPPAAIPPAVTIPSPAPTVSPPAPALPTASVPMPESRIPVKRLPPEAESATGGIWSDWFNPASLALLGGLGLLFGGIWYWWQHRARTEAGKEEALAFEEAPSTGITATAGPTDKPALEARKEAAPVAGRRIARTVPNPLERADLLLAVGNYAEAKNLLRQALQEDPQNNALRTKLLDVHFANQDADAFLQEAKVLYESLEDKADPLWLPVAQQGQKLCPGHELFSQGDELLIATKTIKADLGELERPAKTNAIRSGRPADEQVETTLFNALNEPTLVADEQKQDNLAGLDWQLTDVNKPTITTGIFSRPPPPQVRPKAEDVKADRPSLLPEPLAESPSPPWPQPKLEDTGADRLSLVPEPLTAPPTQPRTWPKSGDAETDKLSLTAGFLAEPPTQPRTQPKPPEHAGADKLSLLPEPLTAPPIPPRARPELAGVDEDGQLSLTAGFFSDPITQPKTGIDKTRIEQELEWRLKDLEQPTLNTASPPVRLEETEKSTVLPAAGLDFESDSRFARNKTDSRLSVATVKGETGLESKTPGPAQQPTQGLRESSRGREDTLVNRTEVPTTKSGVRILMGEDYTETKLDLAMAYLEMGDPVGAHSLLEEVLQEGNEDQRQRARGYLEKIGLL